MLNNTLWNLIDRRDAPKLAKQNGIMRREEKKKKFRFREQKNTFHIEKRYCM